MGRSTMRLQRALVTGFAALFAAGLLLAPAPVGAEGLFDFLFGPDPAPQPQVDPQRARRAPAASRRAKAVGDLRFAKPKDGLGGSGFSTEPSAGGFCVRICDGYFFPLIKSTQATRQQSCELACPSAPMEIFDGGSIESARNARGQRYASLPVAFAFRDRANGGCTCNDPQSSQAFFERTARNDPTLQSGDILVEDSGAFVYRGEKLVPLSDASFMSSVLRDRLRAMLRRTGGVRPAATAAPVAAPATPAQPGNEPGKDDQTGSTN
jgi:hypothetical protein